MLETVVPASDRKLAKLEDLKADLGITDTANDAVLTRMIEEASDIVRSLCGREFVRETVKETLQHLGGHRIILTRTPVWSISAIEFDGVSVPTDDVVIDDDRAGVVFRRTPFTSTQLSALWLRVYPLGYGAPLWSFTYDAGYDPPASATQEHPMPRDIQRATLEIAKALWIERKSNPNVTSIRVGEAAMSFAPDIGPALGKVERLLMRWTRIL